MKQKGSFCIKHFSILLMLFTLSFFAGCSFGSTTGVQTSTIANQGKPEATTPGTQFLKTHSITSAKWPKGKPAAHSVVNPGGSGSGCPAAGKRVSPPPQVEPGIQATQSVVFVTPEEVCGRMNVLWHDCDRDTYGIGSNVINTNKCKEYPDPRDGNVMVAEQDVTYTDTSTGTGSSTAYSFFQLILCDQFGNVGTYQAFDSPK